jgi:hypothetical protein
MYVLRSVLDCVSTQDMVAKMDLSFPGNNSFL